MCQIYLNKYTSMHKLFFFFFLMYHNEYIGFKIYSLDQSF